MTYVTTTPKRRQPRPLTESDRLRQEIAGLRAEMERQQKRFDAIVADLQRQHREKVQAVVDDANRVIEGIEARANEEIALSQQAQVDDDNQKLAVWVETNEALLADVERLEQKNQTLQAELETLRADRDEWRRKAKARSGKRKKQGVWDFEE